MDDISVVHGDRVQTANNELAAEMMKIREDIDKKMRERISHLGNRMLDIVTEIEDERVALVKDINVMIEQLHEQIAGASISHSTSLNMSASAHLSELTARMNFLATGQLPEPRRELPPEETKPPVTNGHDTTNPEHTTQVDDPNLPSISQPVDPAATSEPAQMSPSA